MSRIPPGLKPFKPGQSGNPGGLSKKKRAEIAFKQTSYQDFILKLQTYGASPQHELDQVIKNPDTPAFDLMFVRIFNDAINGKSDARNIILDRLWGKVKTHVELSQANDSEIDRQREELRKLSFEELAMLLQRMIPNP
jgi:hypothetical protein